MVCEISVPAHEAFDLEIQVPVSMEANYSTDTDSRTHPTSISDATLKHMYHEPTSIPNATLKHMYTLTHTVPAPHLSHSVAVRGGGASSGGGYQTQQHEQEQEICWHSLYLSLSFLRCLSDRDRLFQRARLLYSICSISLSSTELIALRKNNFLQRVRDLRWQG